MTSYNNQEKDFQVKEQELRAKEAEIRLRELELEINQQSQQQNSSEIPHYQTSKHEEPPSSLKLFTKKMVRVGKFLGFTVLTLAVIKIGITVGMWVAYGLMAVVIIFIAYQIFLNNDDD